MKLNDNIPLVFLIILQFCIYLSEGAIKRCFACRSRGELGSCKDPFTFNSTLVNDEKGVEAPPCASGWCGKIIERQTAFKEEYGMATQRMCLQRGPSDNEERCATTVWNYRKVYMCFCIGDLCNKATNNVQSSYYKILFMLPPILYTFLIN